MTKSAISVEHLSKAYRIGLKEEIPDTLVGALTSLAKSPFRNFHRLRRLDTFSAGRNGHSNGSAKLDEEDTLWALKDVSFDVQEGEVLGVIGRNGAGKSTLLKILSRITEPTSGRVVIRGRVSSLLEVGTGFHPELSGRENVYMNGTILGMTKREIDRKFDEIVEFSGVEKFLDTPVKRYSSGMKVRLAFAVAAHLEPEILIIDEVLAVGDAEFQKKCLGKMKDVATGGRTVLFVSHNLAAVEALCHRGIELQDGQTAIISTIDEVLRHYRRSHLTVSERKSMAFSDTQYIRDAIVLDENGRETLFIGLGATFHLRIFVNSTTEIRVPRFGIGIDSASGTRVLTVHSPQRIEENEHLNGPTVIDCRVENFPLTPGEYTVKLAMSSSRQLLEEIEAALTFAVVEGQMFGEARGHHRGICIARSDWTISGDAECSHHTLTT